MGASLFLGTYFRRSGLAGNYRNTLTVPGRKSG
jgi:hypothetical protein